MEAARRPSSLVLKGKWNGSYFLLWIQPGREGGGPGSFVSTGLLVVYLAGVPFVRNPGPVTVSMRSLFLRGVREIRLIAVILDRSSRSRATRVLLDSSTENFNGLSLRSDA